MNRSVMIAFWGVFAVASGAGVGCHPKIEPGVFACELNTPGACPDDWICLRWGHERRCFPDDTHDCGNGALEPGEECDQLQFAPGAACDKFGEPPEGFMQCDDDCRVTCNECGDGHRGGLTATLVEECDDGNNLSGDGCSPDCTLERCGNWILDPGEECDDGNVSPRDGCSPLCKQERCGNGMVELDTGEQCDDGNFRSHDGCSSTCRVELPIWQQWRHPFSEVRSDMGMVYDEARGLVVMFGGNGGLGVLNDTWTYDGDQWLRVDTAHKPPARRDPAMAYDPIRERVVLFGGRGAAGEVGDTWEFDGTDWVHRQPVTSPSPRALATLAYDRQRARMVLFGGMIAQEALAETWEYDGVDWISINPMTSPSARAGHAMSYHHTLEKFVLYGGANDANPMGLSDTWTYDGLTWTEISTGGDTPGLRQWHAMAYDAARGLLVINGGDMNSNSLPGEIFEFDGVSWSRRIINPRSTPFGHGLVYDVQRSRVVQFGGSWGGLMNSEVSETWEYDGNEFTNVTPALSPGSRLNSAAAFDSTRDRAVLYGGYPSSTGAPSSGSTDTWQFDGFQWWKIPTSTSPGPRAFHAMAFDPAQGVVLFGGYTDDECRGDTWGFDGLDWVNVNPPVSPEPRCGARMIYDDARGVIVLFGGQQDMSGEGETLNDTWELADGTWTQVVPDASMVPEAFVGLAYDAHRERVVLVKMDNHQTGGNASTWELDGLTWEHRETFEAPGIRSGVMMVFDRARGRSILFGGLSSSFLGDTWEYDGLSWYPTEPILSPGPRADGVAVYDNRRHRMVIFGGDGGGDETWELTYHSATPDEVCGSGQDDDGDGLVDCDDPDCNAARACAAETDCANGVDDDGDGLTDCEDPNCGGLPCGAELRCFADECRCPGGSRERVCDDGLDNDCDGRFDDEDPDCDLCGSAVALVCGVNRAGTTEGGPADLADYACLDWALTGPEAYYRFTASVDGPVTVTVGGATEADDPDLVILGVDSDGVCDAVGQCLAGSSLLLLPETLTFDALAGRTYIFVVDGFNGAASNFSIAVSCP